MHFEDTPEEAVFRAKARAWLEANAELRGPDDAPADLLGERADEETIRQAKEWQAKKTDAAWACLTWPKEYGGQGLGRMENVIFNQEEAKFKLPPNIYAIGHGMLGPTLIAHGTEEQKAKYLPKMIGGSEVWCQAFSEPDAGSDLAALRTSAVRDGDDWILNGQKIWCTGAQYCDWGMMPARSDPNATKHAGLTYFIVDMRTPGIEIRPIKQINGGQAFNEIFLSDVRVPDSDRLGAEGDGWRVAITTLMNERLSIGTGGSGGGFRDLLRLARESRRNGKPAIQDSAVRQKLADIYIRSKGLQYTGYRTLSALSPGPRARSARRSGRPSPRRSRPLPSSSREPWAHSWTRPPRPRRRTGRRRISARRACASPEARTRS
jgi:alkylation response protein AidB-like acyl-CoA dehydrogenase